MNLSAVSPALKLSALLLLAAAPQLCAQVNYGSYNMILKEDLTLGSTREVHVNGPALVGGNLNLRPELSSTATTFNYEFGTRVQDTSLTTTSALSLAVYGTVTNIAPSTGTSSVNLQGHGDYYFANNAVNSDLTIRTSTLSTSDSTGARIANALAPNSTGLTADPLTGKFNSAFQTLERLSANLNTKSTAGITYTTNQWNTTFTGLTNAVNYYTIVGSVDPLQNSELLSYDAATNTFSLSKQGLQYTNLSSSHKLVLNIELPQGTTFNFAQIYAAQGSSVAANLLWNITGAQTVTFNQNEAFWGNILATNSDLQYNSTFNLWGQIFAKSFTFNSNPSFSTATEFHGESEYAFYTNDMMPPIPEPSTYALFGAGSLAGLALFRRHRRKAA